jgi:septum formation protein
MIVFLRHAVKEKSAKKPNSAGTYVLAWRAASSVHRVIILASSSTYRRDLLKRLELPFEVRIPDVDESPVPGEDAEQTALRLAEAKARAASGTVRDDLVIGSDQVAEVEGRLLGKPGDHESAVKQLQLVRSKRVVFHTALCLYKVGSARLQLANVPTTVKFRELSDAEIQSYLLREKPYDCAGSARVEGLGIALIEDIVSTDPTALIGLPLMQLVTMLRNEGVNVLGKHR